MGKAFNTFLAISTGGLSIPITKAISDSNKKNETSASPSPLPQPPSPDAATTQAEEITKRRRAATTQTIYTSPLGISGQADINRKTLLGQ